MYSRKSSSAEGEIMSPQQLKHGESSMRASGQMATELECQQRDIVAAHILVQMANEDSALLHHRLSLPSMKGQPKMRREKRGDRIGGGNSHSEVARRKAKCFEKRQQAVFGGQMNDADSVVLALSARSCRGRRKHRKMNIGMELSSIQPNYINTNDSDDKDDSLCEDYGVLDGHELTSTWRRDHYKSFKACIEDCHGRFGVLREKNVDVAGSVNIPRHVKYTFSEEEDDNMKKAWHGHELTESWGNNYQKPVEAGLEDRHDRLGMLSIKKRKRVARSYFKSDAEDAVVPVKRPLKAHFKLAVPSVERLHPVGSPPAPPLVSIIPKLNKRKRFTGGRKRMIATISPSSAERRAYFQNEEALRYLVPSRGFSYTALDGRKSAVAPLRKVSTTHQDHVILKADRPPVVSIACLVRDAAARLPGGMGNRADICTLMRDSQYLIEDVSDEQLHYLASKGLDRLHYEVDPCVKYEGKVWIYLHRNRGEEDFEYGATSSAYKSRRYRFSS